LATIFMKNSSVFYKDKAAFAKKDGPVLCIRLTTTQKNEPLAFQDYRS